MNKTSNKKISLEDCLKLAKEIPIDQWNYERTDKSSFEHHYKLEMLTAKNSEGTQFNVNRYFSEDRHPGLAYEIFFPFGSTIYSFSMYKKESISSAPTSAGKSVTSEKQSHDEAELSSNNFSFQKRYGEFTTPIRNSFCKFIQSKPLEIVQLKEFYETIMPPARNRYLEATIPDPRERHIASIMEL